ncbi:MAG: hypothetical protein A2X36_13725 [Elusimicrobia bacterium GWA2_69_24]|nr:MAG: hypothetical protein A2X36_13725 [Elusimicrobia bacterium GWA2_69_24]
MSDYFINEKDFGDFLKRLVRARNVLGPKAKRGHFVFGRIENPEDLRLDYDVTILPPKKAFFPTCQDLVRFDGDQVSGCIDPVDQVLFGVHFYDVKAIDMTDLLFAERGEDRNYTANRQAATIVASSIQSVSPRAFWGSVGKEVEPKGHDAFLTKVARGYVYQSRTPKGSALLELGKFRKAEATELEAARKADEAVKKKCPETLKYGAAEVAKKVRAAFPDEKLWERLSERCFSCGSCNLVCPTCYCFDVQDHWNVDQRSGARTRYWDACLTSEFSKVSLGAGNSENFRESRGERFRHRILRKASYLNEKLGGPACVGCGRCAAACTADIADPVKTIREVMEAAS